MYFTNIKMNIKMKKRNDSSHQNDDKNPLDSLLDRVNEETIFNADNRAFFKKSHRKQSEESRPFFDDFDQDCENLLKSKSIDLQFLVDPEKEFQLAKQYNESIKRSIERESHIYAGIVDKLKAIAKKINIKEKLDELDSIVDVDQFLFFTDEVKDKIIDQVLDQYDQIETQIIELKEQLNELEGQEIYSKDQFPKSVREQLPDEILENIIQQQAKKRNQNSSTNEPSQDDFKNKI